MGCIVKRDKFNNTLKVRCPLWLMEAIVHAADQSGSSVSNYVRQTIINDVGMRPEKVVATNGPHESNCSQNPNQQTLATATMLAGEFVSPGLKAGGRSA